MSFKFFPHEIRRVFNKDYLLSAILIAKFNIVSNYKSSFLGIIWTILMPLSTVMIYAFIIGKIFKYSQPDYPFFLISGLLPWIFISSAIIASTETLIQNRDALMRCVVSKTIFPLSIVFSSSI